MTQNIPDLSKIEAAHKRISSFIHKTPVFTSSIINGIAGAEIFFKCENFQRVGAFKFRGACNAVLSLSEEERKKGVATHSSGNHAQGLALAAKLNNIPAYIVMPKNAPAVKKNAVLGYGAEVIDCEATLQSREDTLEHVVKEKGAYFVHPFNDYDIIAGQATASKELIEETGKLDVIMAPVGGGGLLSGTALTVNLLSPATKVVAGEPAGADDAYHSLKAGKIIPSTNPNTIADGLLTSLGTKTFEIISKYVDEIIMVSDEEIINAMRLVWERMKIVIEPSAAVPFAALLKEKEKFQGQRVGIIISGGNVDLGKLPF
ncbi:pyridoxal-phosphate dependent enzyme [Fulvivirgaceae bacterium BMA10]|uniref:Pyridoxal-phosphate dependent enzyme n=1 Tax=Splendidivirga corallicola TaxID=3051826 RepID=A0ABT8KNG3_9BACT|nr:pyridoxal-phosphate dependent enzyme [Fulvivirgaceae bacterium BMA10]